MELKLTHTETPHSSSVEEIYLKYACGDYYREKPANMMIELVHYLRDNIEAPPQWATISMSRGCLYITELNTWDPGNARVEISLFADLYEIRYRIPDEQAPYLGIHGAWIVAYTPDVAEAAQMIEKALELAAVNLPARDVAPGQPGN